MSRSPHGYSGRILTVDLSSRTIGELPTQDYVPGFVGGRGIAARLYWDRVPATAGALDSDNALVFATGPLAGIPSIGGSRWVACGKSPTLSPEYFTCANLGGNWGLSLKSAGYDALVVQGRAERRVYLLTDDDRVDFERTKAEYYRLRGWDPVTGLQSRAQLEELGLTGIADGLLQKRLARD